ncbi:replication-associated recombination protein A [Desulfonatronum thioautotrophicum]|uniref:replication-associated recombination protein A n=1 Tax=Desulfonatronum thioautotrophicum TaxID=617001 RepID=UPI0005EB7111|nr:replication-associated recombination protein A [Desulfonatronum thioautotrophicum]
MNYRQPLAAAIRPTTLEDFVGQDHLRIRLNALFQAKRMPSLLLFGPPGCGKSTLALLLATSRNQPYLRLSAPEVGLANLRKKLENIEILVLDELHRFSKAQQDFFLPILESGEITLLATTTENPSFSVTKQLLSRMHVLRLRPLSRSELTELALRGARNLGADIPQASLEILTGLSNGDARTLFNLLELTAELPPEKWAEDKLRQALPEVVQRGDRDGDSHYELASALIKSIRGSDPDAALYYLACLLEGGEDPRFICRRLILSASEDVGLADPQALSMAVACQQAVEFVGMPEGFIPLAETVVYLSLAPKSNTTYAAYLAAQKEIRANGPRPVPLHLRNASTALQKEWGYGRGYKYPHAYPDAWVEQDYLPTDVTLHFYEPKLLGQEPRLNAWLAKYRKKRKAG